MQEVEVVLSFTKKLKYSDLEAVGIDTSTIAVCKKLRRLAFLDRVKIDETIHRSGINKHLFDYIESQGINMLNFVKDYLSHLQPYMIERRKDQEYEKGIVCVVDTMYRISVYIKADVTQFDEIIISFHEYNKRGLAVINEHKDFLVPYVPVFIDTITGKLSGENKYTVRAYIQRGLFSTPVEVVGFRCKDVFVVSPVAIEEKCLEFCNNYIKGLYLSEFNLNYDMVNVFKVLEQLSFTSWSRDAVSSISLLIDSVLIQESDFMKMIADSALTTYVKNLKIEGPERDEAVRMLEEKYVVFADRKTTELVKRVVDLLNATGIGRELELPM